MNAARRSRRVARDVSAASLAFLVVFAVAYVVGRAAMPGLPFAPGDLSLEGAGDSGTSIASLRADLVALDSSGAVVATSGAVEAKLTLDRAESQVPWNWADEVADLDEITLDLHLRLTGSDGTLTIKTDQIGRDEPRTDRMTVVFTTGGMTFNPRSGMCSLELRDVGYTTEQRPWGEISLPRFDGQLVCTDVPELRSGDAVTFWAVFAYQDH
jgi:hypothetical protein